MDKKQEAVVSNRLEPLDWRTTQRENRDHYEQRETAEKWGSILTAIINYQNKHNGQSPTDIILSKDTGLTVDQVRYHLRRMEQADLIKDIRGWPRHIVVANATKVQAMTQMEVAKPRKQEEANVVHSHQVHAEMLATPKRGETKPFIVRAKEVAQAIIDHYDQFGHAPRMKWIKARVYKTGHGATGGGLSGVIKQMTELGWVYHKKGCRHDLAVTGLGRAALFGQVNNQLHTDTPINPMPSAPQAAPEPPPEPVYRAPPPKPRPSIPRPVARPAVPEGNLANVPDVDLILELNSRGFRVSR